MTSTCYKYLVVTINPAPDRGDAFDPECPTRVVLDRIGDKWTVLVIGSLVDGPLRFSALRARIGGVAPKVLTQTLRAMERDGLLVRRVHAEVPPRVEYALSSLGATMAPPLKALGSWSLTHGKRVEEARDRFDARAASRARAA